MEASCRALVGRESRDIAEQNGVAVGLRLGDEVGAEIGRGTGLVLDDDRLADQLGHLGADETARRNRLPPPAGYGTIRWIGLLG